MDDAHDAEHRQTPYIRLPWPLVAAGLAGMLLVALAAGLFANRYLRPEARVQPTPVVLAAAATAPGLPPATFAATPTLRPASTATPRPTAVPTSTLVVRAVGPTVLATSRTPSAQPTLDPSAVAEVAQAYETYWHVRAQALLDLDKSHIDQVMSGDHMDSVMQLIDQLISENRAIKTSVDHDFRVVQIEGDYAQVFDDYISDSFYVNSVSQQPITDASSDELRVIYRLTKIDGKWKVTDSVQAE